MLYALSALRIARCQLLGNFRHLIVPPSAGLPDCLIAHQWCPWRTNPPKAECRWYRRLRFALENDALAFKEAAHELDGVGVGE